MNQISTTWITFSFLPLDVSLTVIRTFRGKLNSSQWFTFRHWFYGIVVYQNISSFQALYLKPQIARDFLAEIKNSPKRPFSAVRECFSFVWKTRRKITNVVKSGILRYEYVPYMPFPFHSVQTEINCGLLIWRNSWSHCFSAVSAMTHSRDGGPTWSCGGTLRTSTFFLGTSELLQFCPGRHSERSYLGAVFSRERVKLMWGLDWRSEK